MTWNAAALLAAASLYAGFQWTVRVVVYPQFAVVPHAAFAGYEQRHRRLITWAVGPLFVLDGAGTVAAFLVRPCWSAVVAGACLVVILGVTALIAVPQHRRLSGGFDQDAYRRLLAADTVRALAAGLAVAAAVGYAA